MEAAKNTAGSKLKVEMSVPAQKKREQEHTNKQLLVIQTDRYIDRQCISQLGQPIVFEAVIGHVFAQSTERTHGSDKNKQPVEE